MNRQAYIKAIEPHYTGYQELHVHSEASYRDAVNTVDEIVNAAIRQGRNAFAITDHGNQMRLFHGFKARTKAEKQALQKALEQAGIHSDEIKTILGTIGQTDSIRCPTDKMWPWLQILMQNFLNSFEPAKLLYTSST